MMTLLSQPLNVACPTGDGVHPAVRTGQGCKSGIADSNLMTHNAKHWQTFHAIQMIVLL